MIDLAKFVSVGQFIALLLIGFAAMLDRRANFSGTAAFIAAVSSAIVMFLIWLLADIAESQRKGLEDEKTDV